MARYTGPKARVSRRLGINVWGTSGETKALDRRPYPPGEHGRGRRRSQNSEYLVQLQEKQKERRTCFFPFHVFENCGLRIGGFFVLVFALIVIVWTSLRCLSVSFFLFGKTDLVSCENFDF